MNIPGAESRSEHPLGKAVVACYRESTGQTPPACEEFAMLPGRGVQAQVEGHAVLAGNRALLEEVGIRPPEIFSMGQALDQRALCYTVEEFLDSFGEGA